MFNFPPLFSSALSMHSHSLCIWLTSPLFSLGLLSTCGFAGEKAPMRAEVVRSLAKEIFSELSSQGLIFNYRSSHSVRKKLRTTTRWNRSAKSTISFLSSDQVKSMLARLTLTKQELHFFSGLVMDEVTKHSWQKLISLCWEKFKVEFTTIFSLQISTDQVLPHSREKSMPPYKQRAPTSPQQHAEPF